MGVLGGHALLGVPRRAEQCRCCSAAPLDPAPLSRRRLTTALPSAALAVAAPGRWLSCSPAISVAASAVTGAAVAARPRSARAQQAQQQSGEDAKRLLLEDPEVAELRRVQGAFQLYDLRRKQFVPLTDLVKRGQPLYEADAVCVGELHDSEADHTVQRLILDALTYQAFLELRRSQGVDPTEPRGATPQNASPQKVAVGVEYFPRQQQALLDEALAGPGAQRQQPQMKLSEFRKASGWDSAWSYDWGLYAPLFRFCKLNATRVIGLNVPFAVSLEVSRRGTAALAEAEGRLPELDLSQLRHRRRFEDMLSMPMEDAVARMSDSLTGYQPRANLDNMYASQTLWDEYMAETAEQYLAGNGGRLVLFAGVNHVWRDAIPDRLEARSAQAGRPLRAATVVPWRGPREPGQFPNPYADYLWCHEGPGGGLEAAEVMRAQRERLAGKSKVFPAGFI